MLQGLRGSGGSVVSASNNEASHQSELWVELTGQAGSASSRHDLDLSRTDRQRTRAMQLPEPSWHSSSTMIPKASAAEMGKA